MAKTRKNDHFAFSAVIKICERSGGKCENPKCGAYTDFEAVEDRPSNHGLHHVFFKSEYFGTDRNMAWNGANLCERCHNSIHHAGGQPGLALNLHLKKQALKRYRGTLRPALFSLMKRREHRLRELFGEPLAEVKTKPVEPEFAY